MPVMILELCWMTLKKIHYVVYPEYSSTIDGMHDMAEEEEIVLPPVTKDWKIIELSVRLKMFQKKVTAEELSNNLV